MTDRVHSFLVVLDQDRRVDNIDAITTALQMVSGVLSVQPMVSDYSELVARGRVADQVKQKLHQAIESAFSEVRV